MGAYMPTVAVRGSSSMYPTVCNTDISYMWSALLVWAKMGKWQLPVTHLLFGKVKGWSYYFAIVCKISNNFVLSLHSTIPALTKQNGLYMNNLNPQQRCYTSFNQSKCKWKQLLAVAFQDGLLILLAEDSKGMCRVPNYRSLFYWQW